ncbi:MFS transporter [Paenibacillus sp. CGMCC 1.16610]|uniref:MFS transporter n=1 Tax=Paenibacillus anseongense TaxID=2682845 RepID=A0ABW9UEY5_9BACL|nr:MFS transporter [Paenibacillus sp. CGMCC 1.16610]MBA2943946.1 MFS transporter [Paenibacillus sp. CGMCC 1.16610]MVQ37835.1 MFS transporter [Paenibacillus anseongense]
MSTETDQKLWNRDFVAVCLSSFFLFMTFYILAVTLPIFVTDTLHAGQQQIGLVMTIFIISTVILRPLTGKWMDEWNRKKIISFALALFMICTAMYPFIHQYGVLLGVRFLHGIGFGMATTAAGAVAIDLVPDRRKGEGIGYFSLFMSLAMVVGPFLGLTIMQSNNNALLFGVCIVFAVLSLLFGLSLRIPQRVVQASVKPEKGWRKFIEPRAIPISLTGSVLAFSYGAITTFLSVYAKANGLEKYASYFFMVFALMIVISRPFTGKWFDRSGPNGLVYPGVVLFTLGMIGLSLTSSAVPFLVAGGLLGLGFGAMLPSFQTIAIQAAPAHRRGLATGTYFLLFDTGYGIGSYVLGLVASKTDYHTMYFVAGIVVACSSLLYYGLHHRKSSVALKSGTAASMK